MKIPITTYLLCCTFLLAAREQPRYPITEIPQELVRDAHAVIRDHQKMFTIHSKSRASLRVLYAVTIFNANDKDLAWLQIPYERLREITYIRGHVYDAGGMLIKKLKNDEITDHSAFDGLYSDVRVKLADLRQASYPYTVEIEYEIEYRFLYEIDGMVINPHENVAVQKASYELNFPRSLAPRYKTYNTDQQPEAGTNNDMVSLTWDFQNIKAQKFEPYSDVKEITIRIEAAPTIFEFEGYTGSMQTWDEYGEWIAAINKGRDILPEETKNAIKKITQDLKTKEEKVKAVYGFLQNKTRYVSIQLGIGGFQPFEASVVDKMGYGDCKALSNYTISLLQAIGIKGYYTLVFAGDNKRKLETDFPSGQFNHVIVAVPNEADTLWLECTSQTNPFGYQGRHTGDRKALLINDNGAHIVNTTPYPAEFNVQSRTADVYVAPSGDSKATVKTIRSGLRYEHDDLHFAITGPSDERQKWLQRQISIPSFDITSLSMQNIKNKIPSAVITASLSINQLASVSGKRLFITPNLMNRHTVIPEKIENRKTPVISNTAYIDVDTIRYHLPENVYPEFTPDDVKYTSRFGEYEARFQVDGENLVYIRKVRMNKGVFPPESYTEFRAFYRSMNKADNVKLVFINKP